MFLLSNENQRNGLSQMRVLSRTLDFIPYFIQFISIYLIYLIQIIIQTNIINQKVTLSVALSRLYRFQLNLAWQL